MKSRVLLGATALTALPLLASAQPVTGYYISLGAGVDFLQNEIFNPTTPNSPTKRAYTFTPGGAGQVSGGYGFGNGLRIELEGDYSYNHIRGVKSQTPLRAGGYEQQFGGFVNALYDFDFGLPVMPYLGLGAGYRQIELDHINSSVVGSPQGRSPSETKGTFAYQGIAGIAYPVTSVPGLAVTAEYRMIGALEPNAYGRNRGYVDVDNIFNHEVLLGVRYAFNAAPPPAPAPVPAPAPAQASARTYLVFFDWDRADLTDRARQIIAAAAKATSQLQVTRIEVTGNTDTTGTAAYNQGLSVRRANNVAAELVRDGVPREAITTRGVGFSNLLVPTGPGVREPQNRRVEIVLR